MGDFGDNIIITGDSTLGTREGTSAKLSRSAHCNHAKTFQLGMHVLSGLSLGDSPIQVPPILSSSSWPILLLYRKEEKKNSENWKI